MNAVGAYDDQLICDLQACKAHLFQSVSGSSSLFYLKKEHAKMKKSFDHAFKYKLSTSLIIVGDSGDEVLLLIRSVLDSYKNEAISSNGGRFSKLKNYTARVSGSTQLSDHEALVDMANQFMVRNEKDSNVNLALEDLEDLFTHCRQDGVPAIIVLEDFHVFAQRQRQTLIYTLLDLMHKKELLFMIVGVTDHADVNTRLEKRVISRLNAQYVFLPCASGLDICESLSKMFALPETEDGAREGGGGVGGPGRGVSRAFAVQFNAQVHSLFGTYSRSVIEAEAKAEPGADSGAEAEAEAKAETEMETETEAEAEAEGGGSDQEEDAISEANFEAGRILPLMQIHREWGRGIDFFTKVALKALTLLSLEKPHISWELFAAALASMEPPSVLEGLLELTLLELQLLVAVLHLHGRSQTSRGGGQGMGGTGAAVVITASPVLLLVGNVLLVFDMLGDVFRTQALPKYRVVEALCGLAQRNLVFLANASPGKAFPIGAVSLGVEGATGRGGGVGNGGVTAQTVLMLAAPYEETRNAFRIPSGGDDGVYRYAGRVCGKLMVSERLRRAVLEPMEPVAYRPIGGAHVSLDTHQAMRAHI